MRQSDRAQVNIKRRTGSTLKRTQYLGPIDDAAQEGRRSLCGDRVPSPRSGVQDERILSHRCLGSTTNFLGQNAHLRNPNQVLVHGPGNHWQSEEKAAKTPVEEGVSRLERDACPDGVAQLQDVAQESAMDSVVGFWVERVGGIPGEADPAPTIGKPVLALEIGSEPRRVH